MSPNTTIVSTQYQEDTGSFCLSSPPPQLLSFVLVLLSSLVQGSCCGSKTGKSRQEAVGVASLSLLLMEQNPCRSSLTSISLCCISQNRVIRLCPNQSISIENGITVLGLDYPRRRGWGELSHSALDTELTKSRFSK